MLLTLVILSLSFGSFSLKKNWILISHSRQKNKGIGIEVCHYLGDGLFQTNDIS